MRRRRLLVAVAGAAALLLTPVMAGAAPLTPAQTYTPVGFFRLCAEAQLDIANIDENVMNTKGISIGGYIYDNYADDFQYSKSSVSTTGKKIVTAAWFQYRDVNETQPYLIRCKMRTGESLDAGAWPAGVPNNGGRFAVEPVYGFGPTVGAGLSTNQALDQECAVVNQRTIDNVWANLSPAEQLATPYKPIGPVPTLKTIPDVVEPTGPDWLAPSPPLQVNGLTLEVKSRALISNVGSSAPANARLEGAHYCTLVAPEYLRDVLLGTATVS